MENHPRPQHHPLILAAAASVAIAGLAATAHFAGLIPGRGVEPPPAATAAAPPVAPATQPEAQAAAKPEAAAKSETPAPATKPRPARQRQPPDESSRSATPPAGEWQFERGQQRVSGNDSGIDVVPARPAPARTAPAALCRDCGTVESVREIAAGSQGSGLGAVAGGVLGGVLGHQVGRGQGKDLATIAGAVGGAVAGHQVEKNMRTEKQYEVTVRFDDGSLRTYPLENPAWRVGDRVRQAGGGLTALRNGEP